MTVHGPGSVLPDDEIACEGRTESMARREFAELTETLADGVDAYLRAPDWSKLAEHLGRS
jgi:hypothetical protein